MIVRTCSYIETGGVVNWYAFIEEKPHYGDSAMSGCLMQSRVSIGNVSEDVCSCSDQPLHQIHVPLGSSTHQRSRLFEADQIHLKTKTIFKHLLSIAAPQLSAHIGLFVQQQFCDFLITGLCSRV